MRIARIAHESASLDNEYFRAFTPSQGFVPAITLSMHGKTIKLPGERGMMKFCVSEGGNGLMQATWQRAGQNAARNSEAF
jgi:hypothetical protein